MKLSSILLGVSLTLGSGFGAGLVIEEYNNALTSVDFFEEELRDKISEFQIVAGGDSFKRVLLDPCSSSESVYSKTQLLENASRFIIDMKRLVTMHTMTQQRVEALEAMLETPTNSSTSRTPTEGRSADESVEGGDFSHTE